MAFCIPPFWVRPLVETEADFMPLRQQAQPVHYLFRCLCVLHDLFRLACLHSALPICIATYQGLWMGCYQTLSGSHFERRKEGKEKTRLCHPIKCCGRGVTTAVQIVPTQRKGGGSYGHMEIASSAGHTNRKPGDDRGLQVRCVGLRAGKMDLLIK